MNPDPIRVLIADDHAPFRSSLCTLLASMSDIVVVGEAEDGYKAIRAARDLQPNVILMDIQMPEMNGVDATRIIYQSSPHIGVIVLTMFEDDDSVFAAMRAGARGYLLKGADQSEILRAIHAVQNGEAMFGPTIARRLIRFFDQFSAKPPHPFPELTEREQEVLELLARGMSNADIAGALVISQKTVRNHVSSIFAKLQVADRTQAIIRARDAGLGEFG